MFLSKSKQILTRIQSYIFRTISLAQRNGTQRNMCAYFVPKYAMHVFLQTFGLFMCRLTPHVRHAELVSASHKTSGWKEILKRVQDDVLRVQDDVFKVHDGVCRVLHVVGRKAVVVC